MAAAGVGERGMARKKVGFGGGGETERQKANNMQSIQLGIMEPKYRDYKPREPPRLPELKPNLSNPQLSSLPGRRDGSSNY